MICVRHAVVLAATLAMPIVSVTAVAQQQPYRVNDQQVQNEGKVEPTDSQTEKTVQRGTIGAALGAIIGAIAGGGTGAAVGAVIGAGGGAGTVIAAGRDQLDLQRGTEVTITSRPAVRATAIGGAR